MPETAEIVPDSQHRGLVGALPPAIRNYALLARFDRPIGWWLLFWPCAWGVLLAGGEARWDLVLWLLLGSITMRGAGCVYNDIVDADLDRQVAEDRPRFNALNAFDTDILDGKRRHRRDARGKESGKQTCEQVFLHEFSRITVD